MELFTSLSIHYSPFHHPLLRSEKNMVGLKRMWNVMVCSEGMYRSGTNGDGNRLTQIIIIIIIIIIDKDVSCIIAKVDYSQYIFGSKHDTNVASKYTAE